LLFISSNPFDSIYLYGVYTIGKSDNLQEGKRNLFLECVEWRRVRRKEHFRKSPLRGRRRIFFLSAGLTYAVHQKLLSLHGISFGHLHPRQGLPLQALHDTALQTAEVRMISGASRTIQRMGPKAPGAIGALNLVNNPAFLKKSQVAIQGYAVPFVAEKLHEFSVAQRFFRIIENSEKLQPQGGEAYLPGGENGGVFVHSRIPKGHRG
jgi:hypothetical protein